MLFTGIPASRALDPGETWSHYKAVTPRRLLVTNTVTPGTWEFEAGGS